MTMIERVGAVLQEQMSKVSSGTRTYDDIARKVIEAMREEVIDRDCPVCSGRHG